MSDFIFMSNLIYKVNGYHLVKEWYSNKLDMLTNADVDCWKNNWISACFLHFLSCMYMISKTYPWAMGLIYRNFRCLMILCILLKTHGKSSTCKTFNFPCSSCPYSIYDLVFLQHLHLVTLYSYQLQYVLLL